MTIARPRETGTGHRRAAGTAAPAATAVAAIAATCSASSSSTDGSVPGTAAA